MYSVKTLYQYNKSSVIKYIILFLSRRVGSLRGSMIKWTVLSLHVMYVWVYKYVHVYVCVYVCLCVYMHVNVCVWYVFCEQV